MLAETDENQVFKELGKILELAQDSQIDAIESLAEKNVALAFKVSIAWNLGKDSVQRVTDAESFGDTLPFKDDLIFTGETITGGMGQVRKAKHNGETIAVKTLPYALRQIPGRIERFQREYEVLRRLYHPNIVELKSVSPSGDSFSMEFIDGENAEEWRLSNTCSFRMAAQIVVDIAKATAYAHSLNILHRDIKPRNVVIENSWKSESAENETFRPVLIDFGIACLENETSDLTVSPLGTRLYMAPEQFRGEESTKATDVYGLGGLLYFLISGASPYEGKFSDSDSIRKLVTADVTTPPAFGERGIACPSDLETICRRCLAKSKLARFESVDELVEDLERWLRGDAINSSPESLFKKSIRFVKRNQIAVSVATVLVVFASVVTLLWTQATVAKSKYARSASGMLAVLNALSQSVGQEALLKSPQLADFRKTLLNAYLANHMTILPERGTDIQQLLDQLESIIAVASTARETGELEIAIQLVENGFELLNAFPELVKSELAFQLHVEESRVNLASERYALIEMKAAGTLDSLDDSNLTSGDLLKADLLSDLAWAQYFQGKKEAGWLSACQELNIRKRQFSTASDVEELAKLALAHNTVAYIARKGGTLAQDHLSAPEYVSNTLQDGLNLLGDYPESPTILEVRARLNNTLGLFYSLQPSQQKALKIHRENIGIYESLISELPMILEYRIGMARAQGNLADCLERISLDDQCATERKKAVKQYLAILEEFGSQKDVLSDYAIHGIRLHYSLLKLNELEQAGQVAREVCAKVALPHQAENNSYQLILCCLAYSHLYTLDDENAYRWKQLFQRTLRAARELPGFDSEKCQVALSFVLHDSLLGDL